jgi:hypothetical protein
MPSRSQRSSALTEADDRRMRLEDVAGYRVREFQARSSILNIVARSRACSCMEHYRRRLAMRANAVDGNAVLIIAFGIMQLKTRCLLFRSKPGVENAVATAEEQGQADDVYTPKCSRLTALLSPG